MNCERKRLSLIAGDQFTLNVEIEGVPRELIKTVWFTSKDLALQNELYPPDEENRWVLSLPSEKTRALSPGAALFDITVEFTDRNERTAVYNGTLIIEEKINEVMRDG